MLLFSLLFLGGVPLAVLRRDPDGRPEAHRGGLHPQTTGAPGGQARQDVRVPRAGLRHGGPPRAERERAGGRAVAGRGRAQLRLHLVAAANPPSAALAVASALPRHRRLPRGARRGRGVRPVLVPPAVRRRGHGPLSQQLRGLRAGAPHAGGVLHGHVERVGAEALHVHPAADDPLEAGREPGQGLSLRAGHAAHLPQLRGQREVQPAQDVAAALLAAAQPPVPPAPLTLLLQLRVAAHQTPRHLRAAAAGRLRALRRPRDGPGGRHPAHVRFRAEPGSGSSRGGNLGAPAAPRRALLLRARARASVRPGGADVLPSGAAGPDVRRSGRSSAVRV